jgi:hypothetical protein
MISSLFWDVIQLRMVFSLLCFGKTYWSHLQGSSGPRRGLIGPKTGPIDSHQTLVNTNLHCLTSQKSEDLSSHSCPLPPYSFPKERITAQPQSFLLTEISMWKLVWGKVLYDFWKMFGVCYNCEYSRTEFITKNLIKISKSKFQTLIIEFSSTVPAPRNKIRVKIGRNLPNFMEPYVSLPYLQ